VPSAIAGKPARRGSDRLGDSGRRTQFSNVKCTPKVWSPVLFTNVGCARADRDRSAEHVLVHRQLADRGDRGDDEDRDEDDGDDD
jgi:hypothetical protein